MLHPSQFLINEAWITFRVNEAPIRTLRDGDFNCIALMDAASCYIIGNVMVPVELAEPSVADVRALFEKGWAADRRYPETLYLPEIWRKNHSLLHCPPARAGRGDSRRDFITSVGRRDRPGPTCRGRWWR